MADERTLTREIKVAAPPEAIFEFFTDPAKVRRWQAQDVELDPTPGGSFRMRIAGEHRAGGTFVEIDPPRRLVYTWGWEENPAIPPGSTTIEVTLEPSGDYTIVRLTHRGLPTPEAVEQHTEGWDHYLARLGVAAAGGDPGTDPWDEQGGS